MSRDILSDVLRGIRLRSAVFYYVSCHGKWVAEAPPSCEIAAAVMPGADHVIEYHVVTSGDCWAAIVGQSPIKVGPGDIVMLPQGDAHVMSSAPGMRAARNVDSYFEMKHHQRPFRVAQQDDATPVAYPAASEQVAALDGKPVATLVCGFIGCDMRPFNPLIATLPRLLHLPAAEGTVSTAFVDLAVAESRTQRPGGEALLERMSETMFVDAIRRYVEQMPEESTGWLAGLRDRFVGRALALMHEAPAAPWTIEALSQRIGLSRSALHERFVALIGQTPMQYLTQWRMQIASRLLRESHSPVAAVALDVGYESEAAFARTFKRLVGTSPAAWRRRQQKSS